MHIDLQLNSAIYDWPSMRDGVLAAEEAGFGTFWAVDHLSGEPMGGTSMFECFTLLGALASVTSTIGLGSMVANVFNRPAGTLAAAAASLQAISGGRLMLGLGAGAAPGTRWSREHEALGIALLPKMADRHRAVSDTLDLLDRVWAADRVPEFDTMPRPQPRPPVMLGVNSRELAALAGRRCQMVNVRGGHPNAKELLHAAGPKVERSVWEVWDSALLDADHPRRRELASWGVTRLIFSALRERIPINELARVRV